MRRSCLRLHFRDGHDSFPSQECCNVVDVCFNETRVKEIRLGTKHHDTSVIVRLHWQAKESLTLETLSTITPLEGEHITKTMLGPEYATALYTNQQVLYEFAQEMYEVYNARLIAVQYHPYALIFLHPDGFSPSIFTSEKYRLHSQLKKFLTQSVPSKMIQLHLKITRGAKVAIPKCEHRQCFSSPQENSAPKVKLVTSDSGSQTELSSSSLNPEVQRDAGQTQSNEFDDRFLKLSTELVEQQEVMQSEIERRKREYEEIITLLENLTKSSGPNRSSCPSPSVSSDIMQSPPPSMTCHAKSCRGDKDLLRNIIPQVCENISDDVEDTPAKLRDVDENSQQKGIYQRRKPKTSKSEDRKFSQGAEEDGIENEVIDFDKTMKVDGKEAMKRDRNEIDTTDAAKLDRISEGASDDNSKYSGSIVGENWNSFKADGFDSKPLHEWNAKKTSIMKVDSAADKDKEKQEDEKNRNEDDFEKANSDDDDEYEDDDDVDHTDDDDDDDGVGGEDDDDDNDDDDDDNDDDVKDNDDEAEEDNDGNVKETCNAETDGAADTDGRDDDDNLFKHPGSFNMQKENMHPKTKHRVLPGEDQFPVSLQTAKQENSVSLPNSASKQRNYKSLSPTSPGRMSSSLPIFNTESSLSHQINPTVGSVDDLLFVNSPPSLEDYDFDDDWQTPFGADGQTGASNITPQYKKDRELLRQTKNAIELLAKQQQEQTQAADFLSSRVDAMSQFLKMADILIGTSQRMNSYSDIQTDQLNLDVERTVFCCGKPGVSKNRISDEPDGEHRLRILIESMIGPTSNRDRLWESIEIALSVAESTEPYVENVLDTVICLDTSESMTGGAFEQMKSCVVDFINGIEDIAEQQELEENIAIVTFGGRATIRHGLSNDYGSLRDTIDELTPGGPSPVLEGVLVSLACLSKGGELNLEGIVKMPPRLILISDGLATGELPPQSADAAAADEKEMKILEHAFGQLARCQPADILQGQTILIHVGDTSKNSMLSLTRMCGGQFVDKKDIRKLCNHQRIYKYAADVFAQIQSDGQIDVMKFMSKIKTLSDKADSELGKKDADAAYIVVTQHIDRIIILYDSITSFTNVLEVPDLPPLGTRVVRGVDWTWENQDTEGAGTIFNHGIDGKYLWVLWDNSLTNVYRYGKYGCYDVQISNQQLEPSGNMEVLTGLQVERGPNWNVTYGDQDGGPGGCGVIIREKKKQGRVLVRWQRGAICEYRFGENNMFDLAIVSEQRGNTTKDSEP